jgi:hypothetical protein
MEGIDMKGGEKFVIRQELLVHSHPEYEGLTGIAEKVTDTKVYLRIGNKLVEFERSASVLEPTDMKISEYDYKGFQFWYDKKCKDWSDYLKEYKIDISNKREVIYNEFKSLIGKYEAKQFIYAVPMNNLSAGDYFYACKDYLRTKIGKTHSENRGVK